MYDESLVIEKDGWLFVRDPWEAMSTQPVAQSFVWPLSIRARDAAYIQPGDTLTRSGSYTGCYSLYRGYGSRLQVELPQGPKTVCAWIDEEPLKPPRGGPWQYHWGEWVNQKTGKRRPPPVPSILPADKQ